MFRFVHESMDDLMLCPLVDNEGCAAGETDDHRRRQRVDWFQLAPSVSVGLGRGFQLSIALPLQLQVIGTRYETLDRSLPYEATYPGAEPARRMDYGLADGQIMAWYFRRVGIWTIGGGLGHSVPLGKVPSNPLERGEDATTQAFRSGAGAVVPSAAFVAVGSKKRWGGWMSTRASVPVVPTTAGYLAPWTVAASVGPSVRPIPELQLLLTAEPTVEGQARWDGQPLGGRVSMMVGLDILGTVSKRVVVQARVSATVWEQALVGSEDVVGPAVVASVGFSWSAPRAKQVESSPNSEE